MIPLELVYQNYFIKMETNSEYNYIKYSWLNHPNSEIYRKETERFAALVYKDNFTNLLLDVRGRRFLADKDQDWLLQEIIPRFKDRQIRFAYLIDIEDFEIMDTYKIHDSILVNPRYSKHFNGMIFINEEEAQNWLLEIGLYL